VSKTSWRFRTGMWSTYRRDLIAPRDGGQGPAELITCLLCAEVRLAQMHGNYRARRRGRRTRRRDGSRLLMR
jgi:hypothetical protein